MSDMSASAYAEQITTLETQMTSLQSDLDQVTSEFIAGLKSWLPQEFKRMTQSTIEGKPQQAKSMGLDGLKQLKADIDSVVVSLPTSVPNAFPSPEQRWYRTAGIPDSPYGDDYRRKESEISFDEPIRMLLGLLGAVLVKHKLATAGYGDCEWQKKGMTVRHGNP